MSKDEFREDGFLQSLIHSLLGALNRTITCSLIILTICMIAPAHASETTATTPSIIEFFQAERQTASSIPFRILSAHADYDFLGGFADGRYELANHQIQTIAPDIYQIDLEFYKKRGSLRYRQQQRFHLWYDGGDQLVVKDGDEKRSYPVRLKTRVTRKKIPGGFEEIVGRGVVVKMELGGKRERVNMVVKVRE